MQVHRFLARAYAGRVGPASAEEGLEHPIEFGCESNLGSVQQKQESILKGGSLNIFSVPYSPSPTICYWTLGNGIPKARDRKQDLLFKPQNGHSL